MTVRDSPVLSATASAFGREFVVPGLSAGLVSRERWDVVHAGVAGPDGAPVTDQVAFCIGSISKSLTSACVLRLRDDGLLTLDDPLDVYLPEVREFGRWGQWGQSVTLRSLLHHTSGLPCESPSTDLRRWEPLPVSELLAVPTRGTLAVQPGAVYKYSNLGYELLGEVVARTTGRRYDEAVRTCLLEPLGMGSTWLGQPPPASPDGHSIVAARGHGPLVHGARDLADPPPRSDGASGGWWSTAHDLASWVQLHLAGGRPDVVTDAVLLEMHRAVVDTPGGGGYGMGWRTYRRGRRTTSGHGGLTRGFEARIEIDPEQSRGVVVLMSAVGPDGSAEWLAHRLLEIDTAGPPQPPAPRIPTPQEAASADQVVAGDDVTGVYREMGFEWTVSLQESSAGLTLTDEPERWVLEPTADPDRYVVPGGRCVGEQLVVLRDDRGAVEGINVAGYPMTPVATPN